MRFTPLRTAVVMAGLLLSLLLQTGCRRSARRATETPSPDAPAATSTSPASPAGGEPKPHISAAVNPATTAVPRVVEELNYALQDYIERTSKMPGTLEELYTATKRPPPQLPPGTQVRLNQRYKMVEFVPVGAR